MKKDVIHLICAIIVFLGVDITAVIYYINAYNNSSPEFAIWEVINVFSLAIDCILLLIQIFTIIVLSGKVILKHKESHTIFTPSHKSVNQPIALKSILLGLCMCIIGVFVVVQWFWILTQVFYTTPGAITWLSLFACGIGIVSLLFWTYICGVCFKNTKVGILEGWTFMTAIGPSIIALYLLLVWCWNFLFFLDQYENFIMPIFYTSPIYILMVGTLSVIPFLIGNIQNRQKAKRMWAIYSLLTLILTAIGVPLYFWCHSRLTTDWKIDQLNLFAIQIAFMLALNVINIFVTLPTLRKKYRPPFDRPVKDIWKAFA